MLPESAESYGTSHETDPLAENAEVPYNERRAAPVIDIVPLRSIARLWRIITAARRLRSHEPAIRQRLQALQQDNARLREKVDQLSQREARARYLANHDGLTGLCNRSLLMDRFVQAAAHAKRCGHHMALLLFDLDGFKAVNDRYGHLAGDRLLQCIAERISKIARNGDTTCRYGGDEFVLLLPGIDSLDSAQHVAQRIGESITDCLRDDDIPLDVRASCGIAMYPDDGSNWNDLMEAADAAMYRSKPAELITADDADTRDRRARNL